MEELLSSISRKLLETFFVNNKAAGFQDKSGIYLAKYVDIDENLIKNLLLKNGSMSCYQQFYRTDKLRWICLDFDCLDKEHPNLNSLYFDCIKPITNELKKLDIDFVTEFSGRRGIHIWIFFSEFISKSLAFKIITSISKFCFYDQSKYALDLFPKTAFSKNNKLGLGVKLPLSSHKKGGRSYFFENEFVELENTNSKIFFKNQLEILNKIKNNEIGYVLKRLDINDENCNLNLIKKVKVFDTEVTSDQIIDVLYKIDVFKLIIDRLKKGFPKHSDWFILLGTLAPFNNVNLIVDIFRISPLFNENYCREQINLNIDSYYPCKILYLRLLENIDVRDKYDELTGIEVICNKLSLDHKIISSYKKRKKELIYSDDFLLKKEIRYLKDNDESVNINYLLRLQSITNFDFIRINNCIEKIENAKNVDEIYGIVQKLEPEFCIYKRSEESKERYMVSLSPFDRLLSTSLMLRLAEGEKTTNSFSYNINYISCDQIFYSWFKSWDLYLNQIRTYLDVPFLNDKYVISLDFKNCYETIDFGSFNRKFKQKYKNNILQFLIRYNEKIRRKQYDNSKRVGVPQGPAYARFLCELFLDEFVNDVKEKFPSSKVLRYVDDITIFCDTKEEVDSFYSSLPEFAHKYSLQINTEKTKKYGLISELSMSDRDTLLRKDKFNYLLRDVDKTFLISIEEKNEILNSILKKPFSINDISFVFSQYSSDYFKRNYLLRNYLKIFSSKIGRGSVFKKVYQYLFENISLFEFFISNGTLLEIPVDTVNFSNFISTLYLKIQEGNFVEFRFFVKYLIDHYKITIDNIADKETQNTFFALEGWCNDGE